jgi:glycosyltransferase involved in cell wall biosynthesis
MSVAKLCEELSGREIEYRRQETRDRRMEIEIERQELEGESRKTEYGSPKMESRKTEDRSPKTEGRKSEDGSPKTEGEIGKMGFDSSLVSAQDDFAQHDSNIVTVYTTLANGKEELSYKNGEVKTVEGVEVHYFKRITKDHSHLSPALLWHLWKTVKTFDIIHVHAWWNLVSIGGAVICILRNKKYILSPRGTLGAYSFNNRKSKIKQLFHRLIGKPLLRKAIFQVSSKKEEDDIRKILGTQTKIYSIPNFVELKAAWNIKSKKNVDKKAHLLFFSRIEEKKGLPFLLEACSQLNFDYQLTIAGTGESTYLEKLKNIAIKLNIEEKIYWLGQIEAVKKFEVLHEYNLLILPSYDENFANVVIESLASGTPVMISPDVGLADYVEKKDLGWIVKQNSGLMATCLNHIFIDNFQKLNAMSKNSVEIIKQDYAEDYLLKKYMNFYNSMI